LSQNDYWKPYQRSQTRRKRRKTMSVTRRSGARRGKDRAHRELFWLRCGEAGDEGRRYDPDNSWNYAAGELSFLPESKRGPRKISEDFQEKMQEFYTRVSAAGMPMRGGTEKLEAKSWPARAIPHPEEVREYELPTCRLPADHSDLHAWT